MANLNKVCLIGRLTRDPESRSFAGGGKVCGFGFAVNNRRKNQQTGEWEDDPCFLDCKAFNRAQGRQLADLCEQYLGKGDLAYVEGHLVLEKWQDKATNENRSKLVVAVDDVQFLTPRGQGREQGDGPQPPRRPHRVAPNGPPPDGGDGGEDDGADIPF